MGRDDWYRRITWTEEDRRAFFERNRRSRGADNKAQYMRIQAEALYDTDKDELIVAALELVEASLTEYPEAVDRARAFECAGRCCERLGRLDEAISYYRLALQRERELSGIRTHACFYLARLVAETGRGELFDEAAQALDEFGPAVFPWHCYMSSGSRALMAEQRGETRAAKSYALAALNAAELRDSGLRWGRGEVGIVQNTQTEFHERLQSLTRNSGIDE